MRILLAHTSLSGNTRDVARAICARCEEMGHAVTWIDADIQTLAKVCPDGAEHDLYVLGSWSINAGRTPPEMKRFIEDLVAAAINELGAATQEKLFGVLDLKGVADSVIVTTDDGTSGVRGRVTDVLADVINKNKSQAVYACGPMPMLQAVAKVSQDNGAFSQCAVEESMACGIGVCMTCVLPVIGDDGVTRMSRSCVDGPVFRGDRVRWDDVHTVPSDAFGAPRPGGH